MLSPKIAILGGGQLGQMLIQSAIDFNATIFVLDPDADAPCKDISHQFMVGDLTDYNTVYNFGKEADVITIEIENVNTQALDQLQKEGKKVFPQPNVIRTIQDKRTQKQFFADHNVPTSEFVLTESRADLDKHIGFLPAVHKLGRAGYDGRGIAKINSTEDISKGFDQPSVLEKLVDIEKEISVLIARNEKGAVSVFPVVEMVFHPANNMLDYLISPVVLPAGIERLAQEIATNIIEKLEMVGLLAVEMFLTTSGNLLVNELAPRPHNSGHHTIKANATSQYEQHLRAILGLPFGSTATIIPSAMINLLGEPGYNGIARFTGLDDALQTEGVNIHLYGKKFTKPHRKMGHITIVDTDRSQLLEKLRFVKGQLKVVA